MRPRKTTDVENPGGRGLVAANVALVVLPEKPATRTRATSATATGARPGAGAKIDVWERRLMP